MIFRASPKKSSIAGKEKPIHEDPVGNYEAFFFWIFTLSLSL